MTHQSPLWGAKNSVRILLNLLTLKSAYANVFVILSLPLLLRCVDDANFLLGGTRAPHTDTDFLFGQGEQLE